MSTQQQELVTFTDAAVQQVERLLRERNEEGLGLRLAVAGGGCSGLSYQLDFTRAEPGDNIMEAPAGFQVFIDPKSLLYLKNMEVDYQGGLKGRGFVFNNPNAQNSCGCGESFSI